MELGPRGAPNPGAANGQRGMKFSTCWASGTGQGLLEKSQCHNQVVKEVGEPCWGRGQRICPLEEGRSTLPAARAEPYKGACPPHFLFHSQEMLLRAEEGKGQITFATPRGPKSFIPIGCIRPPAARPRLPLLCPGVKRIPSPGPLSTQIRAWLPTF